MSESVTSNGIVIVRRVIDVLSMSLSVGVAVDCVVGIVGEEKAVPGAVLLVLFVLLVAEGLVVGFKHSSLGNIKIFLGYHGWEGLFVWARVPGIFLLVLINGVATNKVSSKNAGSEEPESECLAGKVTRIKVYEVIAILHHWYRRHTTLSSLHSAGYPHSEW